MTEMKYNAICKCNNLFMFQGTDGSAITFGTVIETQVGNGDEPYLTDYPVDILLSGDLELVPWMVGIVSNEGGLFPKCEAILR